MERVAAGAGSAKLLVFEPTKRPDDKSDYCMGCSFLLSANMRCSNDSSMDCDAPSRRDWARTVVRSQPTGHCIPRTPGNAD